MKIVETDVLKEKLKDREKIKSVRCVVIHNVGVPMQKAESVLDFFKGSVGDAQYVIDLDGTVYHCIPDNLVANHAGADWQKHPEQLDPASGKGYTDEARRRFGTKPDGSAYWPNDKSIGIEMCQVDKAGHFTRETLEAAEELAARLLKEHGLSVNDITTHHNIVGWKPCPQLWTDEPSLLELFKSNVAARLA